MPRPRTLPDTPENEKRRGDYKKYQQHREWARKRILALEIDVADLKTELAALTRKLALHRLGLQESSHAPLRVVADKQIEVPHLFPEVTKDARLRDCEPCLCSGRGCWRCD
jgi:hypothetical protein